MFLVETSNRPGYQPPPAIANRDGGAFENPRWCYLVACVALVQQCKASRDKSVEPQAAQIRHSNKLLEVHGKAHPKPKNHFALHVPGQVAYAVQEFGHSSLPDCPTGESEVGTIKHTASHVKNTKTWERSVRPSVIGHQLSRLQGRDFQDRLISPQRVQDGMLAATHASYKGCKVKIGDAFLHRDVSVDRVVVAQAFVHLESPARVDATGLHSIGDIYDKPVARAETCSRYSLVSTSALYRWQALSMLQVWFFDHDGNISIFE